MVKGEPCYSWRGLFLSLTEIKAQKNLSAFYFSGNF